MLPGMPPAVTVSLKLETLGVSDLALNDSSGLKLWPREKSVEGTNVSLEWPKHSIITGAMEKTNFIPARTCTLCHKASNIKHI